MVEPKIASERKAHGQDARATSRKGHGQDARATGSRATEAQLAALVRLRSELEHLPPFSATVSIRGIEAPLLHPHKAGDATMAVVLPERDRWPGVFVWMWRILFGAPRTPEQPRSDVERQATLKVCRAVLAPTFHHLLEDLTDGELMTIATTYIGVQTVWAEEVRERASAAMKRVISDQSSVISEDREGEGERSIAGTIGGVVPLRPGACLPWFMGGGAWGARKTREDAANAAGTPGGGA